MTSINPPTSQLKLPRRFSEMSVIFWRRCECVKYYSILFPSVCLIVCFGSVHMLLQDGLCVYSFLQCAQCASQCQTNEKRESQFSQVAFGKHQSLMHLCCQRVLVNFAIFVCFGLILPWPSCTLIALQCQCTSMYFQCISK